MTLWLRRLRAWWRQANERAIPPPRGGSAQAPAGPVSVAPAGSVNEVPWQLTGPIEGNAPNLLGVPVRLVDEAGDNIVPDWATGGAAWIAISPSPRVQRWLHTLASRNLTDDETALLLDAITFLIPPEGQGNAREFIWSRHRP